MWFLALFGIRWVKYLIGGLAIVGLLLGIYLKGRSDANHKHEMRGIKQRVERENNARKVKDRGNKIRKKVEDAKDTLTPDVLDKLYSCLLSGTVIEDKCTHTP